MMNDVTMMAAVGGRCRRREQYLGELRKVTRLAAGFNLVDLFPDSRIVRALAGAGGSLREARATHEKIHGIMDDMIQEHLKAMKRGGGDGDGEEEDLLGILRRLQRDGGLGITLTTEIISATVFDILAGGSDTTTITVMWAMSEIMRHPRVMQRAQLEVRQVTQGKNKVDEANIGGSLH
uniref:Cytochrome P450 n=1 Tax=Leersia perrieri TaxID=77586 RepID=A0A0D9VAH4_9ORYZ